MDSQVDKKIQSKIDITIAIIDLLFPFTYSNLSTDLCGNDNYNQYYW